MMLLRRDKEEEKLWGMIRVKFLKWLATLGLWGLGLQVIPGPIYMQHPIPVVKVDQTGDEY
jgi:hypothetical protein